MSIRSNIIVDADPGSDEPEAFVIFDRDWRELGHGTSAALGALRWGRSGGAWEDSHLWCFVAAAMKRKRPGLFERESPFSILAHAQSCGYSGPPSLSAVGEWVGADLSNYELHAPLGRCHLMGEIMRSSRLRA